MPTSPLSSQSNPKLLTRMRSKLRLGHYSQRTEQAYLGWVLRFVRHHRLRHPADLGETDVIAFQLGVGRRVSGTRGPRGPRNPQYPRPNTQDPRPNPPLAGHLTPET